jgi:hypothetical protein
VGARREVGRRGDGRQAARAATMTVVDLRAGISAGAHYRFRIDGELDV